MIKSSDLAVFTNHYVHLHEGSHDYIHDNEFLLLP